MIEIYDHLFIGTIGEIPMAVKRGFKIVNTAHTLHYSMHKWSLRGEDHKDDKCYIVHEDPQTMSINWIDSPDSKFFDYEGQGIRNFQKLLMFISKFRREFNVLITCNKGESRAPSVGMLYLAKHTSVLSRMKRLPDPDEVLKDEDYFKPTYGEARDRFLKVYPNYYPGQGISSFLIDNWDRI